MAECSEVADDELCQMAIKTEGAYTQPQKEIAELKQLEVYPQPIVSSDRASSENCCEDDFRDVINTYRNETGCGDNHSMLECSEKKAVVCDMNEGIASTCCDEITCPGDCAGMSNRHTNSSNTNQSTVSICDDQILCDEDIWDKLLSSDSNLMTVDSQVEENLQLSNNNISEDANELATDNCQVAHFASKDAQIVNGKLKGECDEDGCSKLSHEELTAERSTGSCFCNHIGNVANEGVLVVNNDGTSDIESIPDSAADSGKPQAIDDVNNTDDKGSSGLSAKSPTEECSSSKKLPHQSFSSDVLLVAPTGKAANVLGRRTGIQAFTLHHVIFSYYAWRQRKTEGNVCWKFDSVRLLVVDECSLVAVTVFCSLISKVLPSLQKVVLLGDILQLPSIEPGTPTLLINY